MNVTVTKKELLEGLKFCKKGSARKSTLPILECVRIHTRENQLLLETTDLDVVLQYTLPVSSLAVDTEGVMVSTYDLYKAVNLMDKGNLVLQSEHGGDLHIIQGEDVTILPNLTAWDWPLWELKGQPRVCEIPDGEEFLTHIKTVAQFASDDGVRPVLTGMLLGVHNHTFTAICTDGFALKHWKRNVEGEDWEVNVPAKALTILSKNLEPISLNVYKESGKLQIQQGNKQIITYLIGGTFPNWKQVIPTKEPVWECVVDVAALRKKVKRFAEYTIMAMDLQGGKLLLERETSESTVRSSIPVTNTEGKTCRMSISPQLLARVANNVSKGNLLIQCFGKLSPVQFISDDASMALVMPMNWNA